MRKPMFEQSPSEAGVSGTGILSRGLASPLFTAVGQEDMIRFEPATPRRGEVPMLAWPWDLFARHEVLDC